MNGERITCTPEHPFYSPVKGWTSAIDLRAGDILVMLNGEYVVVEQVQHELLEGSETTYNFEVEGFHTYHVGEQSLLVHNLCKQELVAGDKKMVLTQKVSVGGEPKQRPQAHIFKKRMKKIASVDIFGNVTDGKIK
ncbi:MAG: HINT domain-containing protein [Oscillospiraceae bacterium]|nr:MAG: HINT domain-containing protein [Oscillospiraceae bacterium]